MTIIHPTTELIFLPSEADYAVLRMQPAKHIRKASPSETLKYANCDVTVGIPIVKKGFFSRETSPIYAASDDDCRKLGIRNDFVIEQSGDVLRRSYTLEEGTAVIQDSFSSFIESLARSIASRVQDRGAVDLEFIQPGMPKLGLCFRRQDMGPLENLYGTHFVDTVFPDYRMFNSNRPVLSTGVTLNGLEFQLY